MYCYQTFLDEGKKRDEAARKEASSQAIVGPLPLESAARAATGGHSGATNNGPPKARSSYDKQNIDFLMSMMNLPELEVTIALQRNAWHLVCTLAVISYFIYFFSLPCRI